MPRPKWKDVEGGDSAMFPTVIDGLKKIYKNKIKPVEEMYKFGEFHLPILSDADFDAKPSVLLLGQYSTGKTSFIRYLLDREFPGQRIGPEPTTDRFVAVEYGLDDRVIPGNAVAVQADRPYRALNRFGTGFLSKFEVSQCNCPLLEHITLVDTPGVLSGEKQRIGRSYDFVEVCDWFANRADLILLLFDAHKLDISDEFKRAIETLKGHDDKIRIILNKADMVDTQQLMRVYGALMWSLGKVVKSPEVMRVYIGSFWDEPLKNQENAVLFEKEQRDLFKDLKQLPKNSAVRKINELVKRARLAKVHALIISHLRKEMPSLWGKESKQKELVANLQDQFLAVQRQYRIPMGDFPSVERFKQVLETFQIQNFPKLNLSKVEGMDIVLSKDIPKLMQAFPEEIASNVEASIDVDGRRKLNANDFDSPRSLRPEKSRTMRSSSPRSARSNNTSTMRSDNPFSPESGGNPFDTSSSSSWAVNNEDKERYNIIFSSLSPAGGLASGDKIKGVLMESQVPFKDLGKIWDLADFEKRGCLDFEEFCVAMQLVDNCISGIPVPPQLPLSLVPPSKR